MKQFPLSCAILLISFTSLPLALADVEMTQKLESGEKSASIVTRFKLDKKGKLLWVRADQADGSALITNFDKKQVISLQPSAKVAVITRFRDLKKKLPSSEGITVAASANRQEKVDETNTSLYEGTLKTRAGEARLTLWVAEEHPQKALIVPLVQAYAESPVLKATAGLSESLKAAPGVVVKSEVSVGNTRVITTLVSVEEKEVAPEVFEIPEDYQVEKK